MKKFIALMLVAALSTPAFAALPFHKGRTPHTTVRPVQRAPVSQTILNEDFSKFSEGTETEPAAEIEYGSLGWDIPEKWTSMPGWTAQGLHPAGNCVALYPWTTSYGDTRGGYISTPPMLLGGTATITLKAKRLGTDETELWVALCDANYGPKYGVDEGNFNLTDKWQEFTVIANTGSFYDNSYFQIMAVTGKALIDDVKIDFIANRIPAPDITKHENLAPGKFYVEWEDAKVEKYLYTLQCLSEPANPNSGTLSCNFDGIKINADGKTIDATSPNYPDGWTINVSESGTQDVCRDEDKFASAPQSIVFDAENDVIVTPETPEAINEIKFWVKLSQNEDDMYRNSMISVEIWHSDTNSWETIANLNYYYILSSAQRTGSNIYTFDSSAIETEDVTRVRLTMIQKGEIIFYIDDIELSYKKRRDISYVALDKETTETNVTFDGLNTANDYYFHVKAYNDEITSEPSSTVWVDGIAGITPEAPEISNVTPNSFTANWNPVGRADTYTIETTKLVDATEDMPQTPVLEETFDAVTEGTVDAPGSDWTSPFDFSSKGWTKTAWCATQAIWAEGMVGSSGTSYFGSAGLVFTPRLNLNANGGNFNVEFTSYTTVDKHDFGDPYGIVDEGISVYVLKSHSDTEALAGYIVDTPAIGLNSFNIHFENTENCDFSDVIVAFMSKTGLPFFIDYVKITQDLKAGDKLEVPYSVTTTNNTTLDFTDLDSKFDYGVTVTASRNYNWVNYVSNVSARAIARTSTAAGINNVSSANDACAVGGEGQISITAPDSAVADIYTISGILIKSVKGSTSVDVNAGVYIVNISGKNFKLIVR